MLIRDDYVRHSIFLYFLGRAIILRRRTQIIDKKLTVLHCLELYMPPSRKQIAVEVVVGADNLIKFGTIPRIIVYFDSVDHPRNCLGVFDFDPPFTRHQGPVIGFGIEHDTGRVIDSVTGVMNHVVA